ncbi:MAG: hypothetical protein NTY01_18655 [Verrucomicrobia bacterium]|nr:hypothetical protein [Verrucomicrobiota bacterium]
MNPILHPVQHRREFLRSGVRYAILAALAAVASALAARRTAAPEQAGCLQIKLCRGCASLPVCVLPRAAEVRAMTKRS